MGQTQLSNFSSAVRESTLKRLINVPIGFENWKISKNAMSFADVVFHLIECDKWLSQKIINHDIEPIIGKANSIIINKHEEFQFLLNELISTGKKREQLILDLSEEDYNQKIFDSRFNGEVTLWWIIVRGNIDHEIHHRGQLVAYHRVLLDKNFIE